VIAREVIFVDLSPADAAQLVGAIVSCAAGVTADLSLHYWRPSSARPLTVTRTRDVPDACQEAFIDFDGRVRAVLIANKVPGGGKPSRGLSWAARLVMAHDLKLAVAYAALGIFQLRCGGGR
jgi:hypothetical protein